MTEKVKKKKGKGITQMNKKISLVLAIVMAVINKVTGLHHHLDDKEDN